MSHFLKTPLTFDTPNGPVLVYRAKSDWYPHSWQYVIDGPSGEACLTASVTNADRLVKHIRGYLEHHRTIVPDARIRMLLGVPAARCHSALTGGNFRQAFL